MMNRLILGALLTSLILPAGVLAQEEGYERGQLGEWSTWRVAPADVPAFEATVKKVVKAAEMSGLSSDHSWVIFQNGATFGLYAPVENMAEFDDPDAFVKAFKDTPGEALLMEAFGEFATLDVQTLAREVVEGVPAWSYQPEQPIITGDANFAEVYEAWMKPGTEEQADEEGKAWVAFMKELGYGYATAGIRIHFGDVGRTMWVTWYNDPMVYEGENSFAKLIEEKGAGAKLEELLGRWNKLIRRYEESTWSYRKDLSYQPST
jgi:hypothetical protein